MSKEGTVQLNKVHIAPSGEGKEEVIAGNVQVHFADEVRLFSRRQTHRAAEVKIEMLEVLLKYFFPSGYENKGGNITLKIDLLQCQEGSRWGRMCCGGLGFGWVVLETEWRLSRGAKPLLTKRELLRDSGAIGCADVGNKKFGYHTLIKLAQKMALTIGSESRNILDHLDD